MTLIVNLYGGPGTGKSTNTALTFGLLKTKGYNCEVVHEFAKDLTWEKRVNALSFQPYVIGKQMYKLYRLFGQVDIIITDSPILLGVIYGGDNVHETYYNFLKHQNEEWNTLEILLARNSEVHPYNPRGRNQTESEASDIDNQIQSMLHRFGVPYHTVEIGEGLSTSNYIVSLIESVLV